VSEGNAKSLVVIGGGGCGRGIMWLARDCGWHVAGCLDDADRLQGQVLCDVPVVGRVEDWRRHGQHAFVVAIGSPRKRRDVVARMKREGDPRFATLVHPEVRKSRYVEIGEGSMVMAGSMLTTQVSVGRHVYITLNCTVGHDCVIGDYGTIAPLVPVSGNVAMEEGVEIGTGASIRQGVRLGRGCMVGMGSVIVKDVPANLFVLGHPARPVRALTPF
jgi:sugar O-acyltransferase (sialic acid O-acetyltransferase NeuD family)